MTRAKARAPLELERAWRNAAALLLGAPNAELELTVRQDRKGSSLSATFHGGGWNGTLVLSRAKALELSAKEVGALIAIAQALGDDGDGQADR